MRPTLLVLVACVVPMAVGTSAGAQGLESKPLGIPVRSASVAQPTSPASLGSAVLRTSASLAAVLCVIGGAAWGFKQLAKKGVLPATLGSGSRAPSGLLDVLARYPMGGGQSLVVLKFDRRILLVCQSTGKGLRRGVLPISPICEVSEPEDVASVLLKVRGQEQAAMAEKFQNLLASEDAAVERALAPAGSRRSSALAARAHEKSARGVQAVVTGAASASAIRTRLAAMRQQEKPTVTVAVKPPAGDGAGRRNSRTEFVA